VPVSVFNASSELEDLQAYAHLDVERVLFSLPTLPENETLYHLPVVCWDEIYELGSLQIGLLDRRKYAQIRP
jgi:hypothetical protein